jgi:dihydroorotate dehydrogenase (NAD+) catalytic subunit
MNKARLATEVAGIKLSTPVLGASGTFGYGFEYQDFVAMSDVGGIVAKGVTPQPRAGNAGTRIAEVPAGMLNSIGLENPGLEAFLTDILPQAAKLDTAFLVNISAGTVEEYGEMAARLDIDGVDGLEVNISCPNVKEGGIVFGTDPKAAAAVTRAVKEHTHKPVLVKLSPNVTDITVMAKAVEEAGADGIALINTLLGMAIDIRTARPVLGNVTGGLSGPAVKPVALRMVWQAAQTVSIPIIGMGGIMTGEDAVEFLMAGASAVEVGAANFQNPKAVAGIAAEIDAICEWKGVRNVSELVGTLQA